jgi:4-amino-4-deoxy-L-arabinose transferase-like glycosyltransferase
MTFTKIRSFLQKHEWIIPLGLFILFLAFTLPGISWGAPDGWNPDEIVVRSIKALHGEWQLGEINFNYPDLPQYVMFWLGKLILILGYSDTQILIASRVLSAVLAGSVIIMVYSIARRAGGSVSVAGLSGLFLLCVSDLSNNGRFAHNDTYAVFFSVLSILLLLEYNRKDHRGWLYASFFAVGMAASSKYIAGSLVLAPLAVFFIVQSNGFRKKLFSIGETLFVGGALTFLGFAIGTPKSLTWMAFYFKRVYEALNWQVSWGQRADSVRGIFGQFALMNNTLGTALFLLFMAGLLWSVSRVIQVYRKGTLNRASNESTLAILMIGIIAIDLPVMISYNYQPRYLLPFMPMLAILAAFFIENLHTVAGNSGKAIYKNLLIVFVGGTVLFSFARLTSMTLLFMNDSRIAATEFMKTLPPGTSLEHTSYPPSYPDGYFSREHNYPLHIQMGTIDTVPTDKGMDFNTGEVGLLKRGTDYLVVDSFTADKFNDPYVCNEVPVECAFFKQLENGGSDHYKLLAEFKYSLPRYLPRVYVTFANPSIRIYERIP